MKYLQNADSKPQLNGTKRLNTHYPVTTLKQREISWHSFEDNDKIFDGPLTKSRALASRWMEYGINEDLICFISSSINQ